MVGISLGSVWCVGLRRLALYHNCCYTSLCILYIVRALIRWTSRYDLSILITAEPVQYAHQHILLGTSAQVRVAVLGHIGLDRTRHASQLNLLTLLEHSACFFMMRCQFALQQIVPALSVHYTGI